MWKSAKDEEGAASDERRGGESASPTADEGETRRAGLPISKKLLIVLVVGFVLAGGGIFGAKMVLGGGAGGEKKRDKDNGPVVAPLTFEFADIMVNISDTHLTRVLRCTALVEVANDEALNELTLREVAYRDVIIQILRSKRLEDLEYPGENAVKREVRDRFNMMMRKGTVTNVYFKEFLVH